MLDNTFNAVGCLVGELKQYVPNLYTLVTTTGEYETRLTSDLADYVASTGDSLLAGVNTFVVTPFTKERGYTRPQLGQVAHKPYLSFSIFGVNPKRPVGVVNQFDVRATCIKQFEPLEGEEWTPYVLMSLSSMSSYISSQKRDTKRPRTIKLHGVLPSVDEFNGHQRDAVGKIFTLKATLGEGVDNQRLYIVPNSVQREVVQVSKLTA